MNEQDRKQLLAEFSDKSGLVNLDDLTNSFYAKLVDEEISKNEKSPEMVAAIAELYRAIKY